MEPHSLNECPDPDQCEECRLWYLEQSCDWRKEESHDVAFASLLAASASAKDALIDYSAYLAEMAHNPYKEEPCESTTNPNI